MLIWNGRRGDRQAKHTHRRSPLVDQLKALIDNWILIAQGLLASVGERFKTIVRPGDTFARLGGDEFAMLLESGEMPMFAETVADRLAEALKDQTWSNIPKWSRKA